LKFINEIAEEEEKGFKKEDDKYVIGNPYAMTYLASLNEQL